MMAAVGMGWDELKLRCPPNVFMACDNSEDSVTISGEKQIIEKLYNRTDRTKTYSLLKSRALVLHFIVHSFIR